MPELPEVETIRRELPACIVGKRFKDVAILDDRPVRRLSPKEFPQRLIGQTIEVGRSGKYLLLRLSNGGTLIIHLRMTGALLLDPDKPERFTRVIFGFSDGSELVFTDTRRFGVMYLVKDEKDVVGKLGVEPLSNEFTPKVLAGLLAKRKAPIKAVLLDQTVIAGIGNMYADESLFSAKIHPMRVAGALSPIKRPSTRRFARY
ncbi:MAG: DNA-formamidopyrimidine glycosylase [Methanobacteriota archaeon]